MTGIVQCRQLYYRWSGRGRKRGYQVVAASPGISREDAEYIEAHALPVSFSHDSFNRCLRAYMLPSGSTAVSVVQNAGDDELGRRGSYYSHFIIVPPLGIEKKIRAEHAIESIIRSMDSYPSHASEEEEGVSEVPVLDIGTGGRFSMPDVSRYFGSASELGYFIAALTQPEMAVVYTTDGNREEAFADMLSLISILPLHPADLSITTYSASIADERNLFRVFLLDGSDRSASPVAMSTAVFRNGELLNGTGAPLPEWIEGLSAMIFGGDMERVSKVLRRSMGFAGTLNPGQRLSWSYNEHMFQSEPTVEGALQLYETAPDNSERMKYLSHAGEIQKTKEQCRKVSLLFLQRMSEADPEEADSILSDSMIALGNCPSHDILVSHVDSAMAAYRKNRELFPYYGVLSSLKDKPETIAGLASSYGGTMRQEIGEFIAMENLYSSPGYILDIAGRIDDRRSRNRFITHVFSHSFPDESWEHRASFVESYISSECLDHEVAGRMVSALFKESVKNHDENGRERIRGMISTMESTGIPEKYYSKLRKQMQ